MRGLILLTTLLFCQVGYAFNNCHEVNFKGIKGKCFEDITFDEMIAYIKKYESMKSLVCEDIMPMVWQKFDNTHYKEACE